MRFAARAPGKLVVLGEYAVLEGGEAIVMAVDRHCRARIERSAGVDCRIASYAPSLDTRAFARLGPSGLALVDIVTEDGRAELPAWSAEIDSRAFFSGANKLGLGSSAAVLCALAAVWSAYAAHHGVQVPAPDLEGLVACHRRFQAGAGSGLDVAASLTGGVISYRLEAGGRPRIGSVPLPNSVGFAGVFTGVSASTPDFVARFRHWQRAEPRKSAQALGVMRSLAAAGGDALRAADIGGFLEAVGQYGVELERLGEDIGAAIVTPAHREAAALAEGHGLVYKVSGAGGGDLGLVIGCDDEAMNALKAALCARDFEWIDLGLDREGLRVEELEQ
jgi:phosphomevalonate kinase